MPARLPVYFVSPEEHASLAWVADRYESGRRLLRCVTPNDCAERPDGSLDPDHVCTYRCDYPGGTVKVSRRQARDIRRAGRLDGADYGSIPCLAYGTSAYCAFRAALD